MTPAVRLLAGSSPALYHVVSTVYLGSVAIRVECIHREPAGWAVKIRQGNDWAEARLVRDGRAQAATRVVL